MKNLARSIISGAAVLAVSVSVYAPSALANGSYDRSAAYFQGSNWQNSNWQNDDWRWRQRHRHYQGGYGYDPGGAVALGIIGMIAGAMLSDVPRDRGGSWCARHYRTYKSATGTFTGYDGLEHPC